MSVVRVHVGEHEIEGLERKFKALFLSPPHPSLLPEVPPASTATIRKFRMVQRVLSIALRCNPRHPG
jgi:hypothetical protein